MQIVGVVELISGTALVLGTLPSQKIACVGLMCMMALTSYSQMILRDFGSTVMPAGYIFLLLWLYASLTRSEIQLKSKMIGRLMEVHTLAEPSLPVFST
nr:unnamed protein product [Spirometra erinaceieuropaei]